MPLGHMLVNHLYKNKKKKIYEKLKKLLKKKKVQQLFQFPTLKTYINQTHPNLHPNLTISLKNTTTIY